MRRIDVFISKLSEKESELRVQSYLLKKIIIRAQSYYTEIIQEKHPKTKANFMMSNYSENLKKWKLQLHQGSPHPSKFFTFLSLQMYHMIQKGTTFQISSLQGLPNCLFHHADKWTTVLSLTHKTSDRSTINDPNSLAMSLWRSGWSVVSPLDLDMHTTLMQ